MENTNNDSDVVKSKLASLEASIVKASADVRGYTEKAAGEVKALGTITAETSEKLKEVLTKAAGSADEIKDIRARMAEIEQRGIVARNNGNTRRSPGNTVIESAEYKSVGPNGRSMAAVEVGSFHKLAIVNATGQNQPLVPADYRPGIMAPTERVLTVRDMLPIIPTASNLIEYAREASYTNAAASQAGENVAKAESTITFSLSSSPVQTIAHFIPASRQVLSDAPMLAGYVDTRLAYGLKLEEERQLLNGSGVGSDLSGLVTQAAAYTGAQIGDTDIDTLLRSMLQVSLTNNVPTGFVLHPNDWAAIQLLKDTQGRYIFGNPVDTSAPRIWGMPVVATQSMTAGQFLTGAFAQGATIFDREQATVRVAEQHSDFFVRNMVAILAEERIALVVFRPDAFVTGAI